MDSVDAKQAIASEHFEYGSADGRTRIHAISWMGEGPIKGVVQIVHGMLEHIARYDDFARFLAANGYAVCGNDQIGHGLSVDSPERLSCLPANSSQVMLADVHTLRTIFAKRLPKGTPCILFGHSMGSFVVRAYLARYATGLAGAVLCGTGQPPVGASRLGAAIVRQGIKKHGVDATSAFISSLADGAYSKKIKNARTPLDWLNTDSVQVDAFIDDPLCGKTFNLGGYAGLMDLAAEAVSSECAAAVPEGLPMLFIAGEQDPVGDFGQGVRTAAQAVSMLSKAQVRTIIYPRMRHEILNEPGRQRVYDDVLAWLDGVTAACLAPGARGRVSSAVQREADWRMGSRQDDQGVSS